MYTTQIYDWEIINYVSAKKVADFLCLLFYDLITIYANTTKCLSLLQNLMCYLLQVTEMEYYIQN